MGYLMVERQIDDEGEVKDRAIAAANAKQSAADAKAARAREVEYARVRVGMAQNLHTRWLEQNSHLTKIEVAADGDHAKLVGAVARTERRYAELKKAS